MSFFHFSGTGAAFLILQVDPRLTVFQTCKFSLQALEPQFASYHIGATRPDIWDVPGRCPAMRYVFWPSQPDCGQHRRGSKDIGCRFLSSLGCYGAHHLADKVQVLRNEEVLAFQDTAASCWILHYESWYYSVSTVYEYRIYYFSNNLDLCPRLS